MYLNPKIFVAVAMGVTMCVQAAPELHKSSITHRPSTRTSSPQDYEGYAFLYFIGSSEQVYLASSNGNDALSFTELNSAQPVLVSTAGAGGVRDPFVMRSAEGDKFFILATDLCISCGTSWGEAQTNGSLHIEIWESPDLVSFSKQRHVLVSPESYGNTWAPEAYYDDTLATYVVYWASGIYDDVTNPGRKEIEYQRMVYATTDDFVTFSTPKVWQDEPPKGRIDSTVIKEGDVFYRFTKATINGCADIVQESSLSLTANLDQWSMLASCIGTNAGTKEVEGPSIFKTNPGDINGERYILIADEFGGDGYVPLESDDLASGQWVLSGSYNYPTAPRHGTIIPLTASELRGINEAYGMSK
ncbi:unnamed protein product [Clonostachys byssicola]|uniref:Uncharacterized protein n=1 Tax=Clonostachys byssicola TaxID=160290 RepID=A0A9N9XZ05_9HYPO|nr:unnamed protein product [Clonostachys byssicola]